MKKRDSNNQTGASGKNQFSQVDYLIVDIVGKDSPGLQGLKVADDILRIAACSEAPRTSSPMQVNEMCSNTSFVDTLTETNASPVVSEISLVPPPQKKLRSNASSLTFRESLKV